MGVIVMTNYSFDNINKNLEDLTNELAKYSNKDPSQKVGYSSKCKVCNSKRLDDIEELREEGYTLEEIKETLELDLSIMSLSRHFSKHYPKNQRYKLKQQILLLENIKEAYIKYPYLEKYFKSKPLEYLERFNNNDGFCLDSFKLCPMLEARTVSNCQDNIKNIMAKTKTDIDKALAGIYFTRRDEISNQINIKGLQLQNLCLKCKENINSNRLNLLEKIITYNFLEIPIEDKELYFSLLNFDGNKEEFITSLGEIKGKIPQSK